MSAQPTRRATRKLAHGASRAAYVHAPIGRVGASCLEPDTRIESARTGLNLGGKPQITWQRSFTALGTLAGTGSM